MESVGLYLLGGDAKIHSASERVVLFLEIYRYPYLQGHSFAARDLDHEVLADQAA